MADGFLINQTSNWKWYNKDILDKYKKEIGTKLSSLNIDIYKIFERKT